MSAQVANPDVSDAGRENEINASPLLKWPAIIFSYIFHPLFIPVYVALFLLYIHPNYFNGFAPEQKRNTLLIVLINMLFYPLFAVILLRAVGFIQSIYLHTQRDRIIPYIACGIFYFWTYMVFKQQPAYPPVMSSFALGAFLASSAALIANIYFKISMHALAMGGWLGLFLVIAFSQSMLMTWPLAAVIILCGLVFTSRLLVSNHTSTDIYAGFFIGLLSQAISAYVIL